MARGNWEIPTGRNGPSEALATEKEIYPGDAVSGTRSWDVVLAPSAAQLRAHAAELQNGR